MKRILDHGYVKLVRSMGDDNEALKDARMSTDKATGADIEADDRLRNRLLKDQHTRHSITRCRLTGDEVNSR